MSIKTAQEIRDISKINIVLEKEKNDIIVNSIAQHIQDRICSIVSKDPSTTYIKFNPSSDRKLYKINYKVYKSLEKIFESLGYKWSSKVLRFANDVGYVGTVNSNITISWSKTNNG